MVVVPTIASTSPITFEKSCISFEISFEANMSLMVLVSFTSKYCIPICKKGPMHTDRIANKPYTPAAFFIMEALTKTASDASDSIPPTTGTTPDMVSLAAFKAEASVVPLTTPVMEIKPVKT